MKQYLFPLALAALLAAPARAGEAPVRENRTPGLTVTGNGEVQAPPDEATVRIGVTRQAPRAQTAQEQVNTVAQALLNAVTRLGIERADIQTSEISLFPVFAQPRPGSNEEPRVVAYRASNVISIRVRKLTQIGPVIDAGVEAGVNQLEGVQFTLRDDVAARSRALREAAQEARGKATALAEALGVRLEGIVEVQEGGVFVQPVFTAGRALGAARMEAAAPVSPGQLTVRASVVVRYRIRP